MRLFVAVMFLTLLPVILRAASTPPPSSEGSWKSVAFYDPNPAHIWNRLADALLVREGPLGTKYGADSLDPLVVDFDRPLDRALLEHSLVVLDSAGRPVGEHPGDHRVHEVSVPVLVPKWPSPLG